MQKQIVPELLSSGNFFKQIEHGTVYNKYSGIEFSQIWILWPVFRQINHEDNLPPQWLV